MPPQVDCVNDALGIAQFICQHLDENQAVSYLLTIQELSIDDWIQAKTLLPGVNKTNRRTKESNISDIVETLKSSAVEIRYLVANLTLCPGWHPECLSVIFANLQTLKAIEKTTSRLIAQQDPLPVAVNDNTPNCSSSAASTPIAASVPNRTSTPPKQVDNNNRETSQPYLRAAKEGIESNKVNKPPARSLSVQGSKSAVNGSIKPQLRSLCLGIRSGPNETVDTLKEELTKCKIYREVHAEIVSASTYRTVFRVKLTMPSSQSDKWTDPSMWPSRMTAQLWRGDPTKSLATLDRREFTKRIYLGNISSAVNDEEILNNMKKIYSTEVTAETVKTIEVFPNKQSETTKSVCVELTSVPGKTLMNVPLKIDHYPRSMQRFVRWWRGRTPYPDSHEKVKPKLTLNW